MKIRLKKWYLKRMKKMDLKQEKEIIMVLLLKMYNKSYKKLV
jgi:hypothetical protein